MIAEGTDSLIRFDKPTIATMLAGMCTFLNVYSTQPLLPLLRQVFHASELNVSLTVSATILSTALTAPLIGMIAERRGRKKVIVPSLFLLTIPTILAATSSTLGARLDESAPGRQWKGRSDRVLFAARTDPRI